eukprot:CAMPEP_0116878268 /NCGR_PEP_ID=MMETSP0463-20121206/10001_1 /TAXON_ID=181622 /ORGANISM="Strombidinopsis sp, Strain SopsisLIS2011" /LENGTH=135 /DNA_ID=CAMNT_0004526285 /DNA_START=263 /DNA_END=670 /DNA_ORIENTATION=+
MAEVWRQACSEAERGQVLVFVYYIGLGVYSRGNLCCVLNHPQMRLWPIRQFLTHMSCYPNVMAVGMFDCCRASMPKGTLEVPEVPVLQDMRPNLITIYADKPAGGVKETNEIVESFIDHVTQKGMVFQIDMARSL